ncbi:hypothetical protein GCM10010300_81220 [Streptomyces olivaceoviridis]|nr:hypothetical protein GCM10010300_81220 [Streptomyces olivaceoviridis]
MNGAQRHTEPLDVHLIAVREDAAGLEVLLSRRAGDVYAAGCWHLVSGHLDGPWENMVTALVREAREEAGVVIDRADVRAAVTVHHRAPAGGARIGVFFVVDRWEGTPEVMEHHVCDAMGWFSFDALPEPMAAYCRAGVDAYRAGARMAVHFQEPGDPIAYDRSVDRLVLLPEPATRGTVPDQAVRAFAEQAVGRITEWTDASWAREESRVWRVRGAEGGEWYIKIHQNARFHHREVDALRSWVSGLGAAEPCTAPSTRPSSSASSSTASGNSRQPSTTAPRPGQPPTACRWPSWSGTWPVPCPTSLPATRSSSAPPPRGPPAWPPWRPCPHMVTSSSATCAGTRPPTLALGALKASIDRMPDPAAAPRPPPWKPNSPPSTGSGTPSRSPPARRRCTPPWSPAASAPATTLPAQQRHGQGGHPDPGRS